MFYPSTSGIEKNIIVILPNIKNAQNLKNDVSRKGQICRRSCG
mgnify:CR=1 FL=1